LSGVALTKPEATRGNLALITSFRGYAEKSIFCLSLPDITEFALRKAGKRPRAYDLYPIPSLNQQSKPARSS